MDCTKIQKKNPPSLHKPSCPFVWPNSVICLLETYQIRINTVCRLGVKIVNGKRGGV